MLIDMLSENFPLGCSLGPGRFLGALKYIHMLALKMIGWVEKSLRYAYVKFELLLRQKENDQTH